MCRDGVVRRDLHQILQRRGQNLNSQLPPPGVKFVEISRTVVMVIRECPFGDNLRLFCERLQKASRVANPAESRSPTCCECGCSKSGPHAGNPALGDKPNERGRLVTAVATEQRLDLRQCAAQEFRFRPRNANHVGPPQRGEWFAQESAGEDRSKPPRSQRINQKHVEIAIESSMLVAIIQDQDVATVLANGKSGAGDAIALLNVGRPGAQTLKHAGFIVCVPIQAPVPAT